MLRKLRQALAKLASPLRRRRRRRRRAAPTEPPGLEPFGQVGVRQYIVPLLSMFLLLIACIAGMMWQRSYNTVDTLARTNEAGTRITIVRSIYGRIVATREPLIVQPIFDFVPNRWNYEPSPAPPIVRDPWVDSWKKRIGIEWQTGVTSAGSVEPAAWWLRVRWPTIVVVCGSLPLIRVIRFEWSRWRRKREPRGFTPATVSRTS